MSRKPKIKRAKWKWREFDVIKGGYVNLTTGTIWWPDGTNRPWTEEEKKKLLS